MSIAPNPGAAGYAARMARKPFRSNPYDWDVYYNAWAAGWERADKVVASGVKYAVFVFTYGDTDETFSTFALATDRECNAERSEAEQVFYEMLPEAKAVGVRHVGTWYVTPKKSFKAMAAEWRKLAGDPGWGPKA